MHQIKLFHWCFLSSSQVYSTGIINDDIDSAEFFYRFLNRFLDLILVLNINHQWQGLSSSGFNFTIGKDTTFMDGVSIIRYICVVGRNGRLRNILREKVLGCSLSFYISNIILSLIYLSPIIHMLEIILLLYLSISLFNVLNLMYVRDKNLTNEGN